jgi:hypothetical protein
VASQSICHAKCGLGINLPVQLETVRRTRLRLGRNDAQSAGCLGHHARQSTLRGSDVPSRESRSRGARPYQQQCDAEAKETNPLALRAERLRIHGWEFRIARTSIEAAPAQSGADERVRRNLGQNPRGTLRVIETRYENGRGRRAVHHWLAFGGDISLRSCLPERGAQADVRVNRVPAGAQSRPAPSHARGWKPLDACHPWVKAQSSEFLAQSLRPGSVGEVHPRRRSKRGIFAHHFV